MRIDQLAVREPVTVSPDATIARSAELMAEHGVGCLVVTEGTRPVGIVTDRDLVVRGVAAGRPTDGRVDSVMTMNPVTVDAATDLRDVVQLFGRHAVRRLPVVADGVVTRLVSLDDLLASFAGQFVELTNGLTAQLLFPHAGDAAPLPVSAG